VSYFWDELIERFIRIGDPKLAGAHIKQTNAELEEGLRIIASENRFNRRMLARSLREAVIKAAEHPGKRWVRVTTASQDPKRVYIFLVLPRRPTESYEEYRQFRPAVLHAYCRCAQLRFPGATTFIGIGLDHPVKHYEGGSEDLYIYEPKAALSDEERQEVEKYRKELGILPDDLKASHRHDDEFPSPPTPGSSLDAFIGEARAAGAREHAKRRKAKQQMAKESRRRNRRKK